MVVLSTGTNLTFPGGVVIIQNSSFESNTAHVDNGGVINVGEFARVIVEGDGNVFEQNACGEDGAVFAATTNSLVLIEGGTFKGNNAGRVSPSSAFQTVVNAIIVGERRYTVQNTLARVYSCGPAFTGQIINQRRVRVLVVLLLLDVACFTGRKEGSCDQLDIVRPLHRTSQHLPILFKTILFYLFPLPRSEAPGPFLRYPQPVSCT